VHTAQLRLQSNDGPLSAQLVWPAGGVAAVMVLLFDAGEPDATAQAERVCRAAGPPGVLSLSAACRRGHELEDGARSIEWTADHAAQLGAEGAGLILAGLHAGAAVAATLAVRARDDGWPDVMHQLLIEPRFSPAPPPAAPLSGVAPASLIGGDEGSRAYALRLRQAGVPVTHVRHADLADRLAQVIGVPALRHSPDGPAP
jgi:acetyl esterase/lipase